MAEYEARQTPTECLILPYEETDGREAIDLYNGTGRTAQEWQELLTYDLLARNPDNLWTHTKFGYAVPRRNGKNEVVAIRELYGLESGEQMLHTAHRTKTSRMAWERLKTLLNGLGYSEQDDYKTTSTIGMESIRLKKSGGKIDFGTRSSRSGLGEGFDLLIIDEAQEYTDDQQTALKYVVSDSKNPQTIFCGTPPTPVSSGTVFTKLRKSALSGLSENTGWAEWSVRSQTDPRDKEAWYYTNPSLGTIISERSVADEIGDDIVDFNIQRLGLWIRYNLKSEISKVQWEELTVDELPRFVSPLYVGIKYAHDTNNVSMSIATKTADGRYFTECIDCREARAGNGWIIDFLKVADVAQVVVDGASGQGILDSEMREEGLARPLLPTVKQVIKANATFEQLLYAKEICHKGQPALTQSVSNCEKRAIGSSGGFGYTSLKDAIDVSIMESMILALWGATEHKVREKQVVSY